MSKAISVRNRTQSKDKNEREITVPLSVTAPIYLCATALITLYGWGALQTYPGFFAVALIGVFILAEAIKPKLAELFSQAIEQKAARLQVLLGGACVVAMSIGAFGAHGALAAANAPAARYASLQLELTDAEGKHREAQAAVDGLPMCTPDMPRVRCMEMEQRNAGRVADAIERRNQAREREALARSAVNNTADPGAGIPEDVQKLATIGALFVEFIIFIAPFSSAFMQRQERQRRHPAPAPAVAAPAAKEAPPVAAKQQPGLSQRERAKKGWEGPEGEARREKLAARNKAKQAPPTPPTSPPALRVVSS